MVYFLVQLALQFDKAVHGVVIHRLAKFEVYLLVLFEQGNRLGTALFDNLFDGLVVVEFRFLFEIADRITRRKYDLAVVILVDARYNLHQCRFAGTVQTDDADFRAIKEG